MFNTEVTLTGNAIRTESDLLAQIKIGGSFWMIHANHCTTKPDGLIFVTRQSESSFVEPADETEEDSMDTLWPLTKLTDAIYPGAWLNKEEAVTYLTVLNECWAQVPSQINAFAQSCE